MTLYEEQLFNTFIIAGANEGLLLCFLALQGSFIRQDVSKYAPSFFGEADKNIKGADIEWKKWQFNFLNELH